MKRKISTLFVVFLLGTVLFWAVLFISYEIWSELQSERARWGRFVCNPVTGEKKILWSDSGPVTDEQARNSGFLPLTETEYAKQYLDGVKEYGPLKIDSKAPNGEGSDTPIDDKIVPKSTFYIYVQRRGLAFCEFDSCGIAEGKIVECMGGWLSGDGAPEISDLVGLNSMEVAQGKASIVVISDKNSRISGIYPNHTEGDILPILYKFPEYRESLLNCVDEVIGFLPDQMKKFELPQELPKLTGAEFQALTQKARKTAILMPDGSIQDAKRQTIYEIHYYPSEGYNVYRYLEGHEKKRTSEAIKAVGALFGVDTEEEDLVFETQEEALEFAKNKLKDRGYTILFF